jgi:hypothetical protein
VDEDLLLLGGQTAQKRHELAEGLLVLLEALVLGGGQEVEHADELEELGLLGGFACVNDLGIDPVLKVELGDLGLGVDRGASVVVPVLACELGEEVELWLSSTGVRLLGPLRQEEGKREELLAITRKKAHPFNLALIVLESSLQLLHEMLKGFDSGGRALNAIDYLLDLDWVALSIIDLLGVGEGKVFETVDLTEAPEHGVSIFAATLDLEHLSKVKLLERVQGQVVDHLILSERLGRVQGEVGGYFVVGIGDLLSLEETELSDDIV